MRSRRKKCLYVIATLTVVVLACSISSLAQGPQTQNVALTATASESLTFTASGNSVTWNSVTPGASTNAPTTGDGIVLTTTWKLKGSRSAVKVYAYFGSATAALAHQDTTGCPTCIDIPSSAVELKGGDLGATFTPVTGAAVGSGPAGSTLLLQDIALIAGNRNSSATATLNFNLNLSSAAMQQLPADNYTGTLHIVADATL